MKNLYKISAVVALGFAVAFSLLYFTDIFRLAEDRVYDQFLGMRKERPRYDGVVLLDVDDLAIAHVGVFPWPRSVVADGLLRLKEYGAGAAIFDIEYIDKSPTDVDEVYLKDGLRADFNKSFSEIGSNAAELLSAIGGGFIKAADAPEYSPELLEAIAREKERLYGKTLGITRDNDIYLGQAAGLFGRAWATLNLQADKPLSGEQAERRAFAEGRFAYPVKAAADAYAGANVDLLPAIPLFSRAAKGAGYTNVAIDKDGIRRRIFLAQAVNGHWYLQLAFAPLVDYLGSPDIELRREALFIKGAKIPQKDGSAAVGDIRIPLDENGAMLLDWPTTDYGESYTHLSFARLSYLEEYQRDIEQYLNNLLYADESLFSDIIIAASDIIPYFENARAAREAALAGAAQAAGEAGETVSETAAQAGAAQAAGEAAAGRIAASDEAFAEYVQFRNEGLDGAEALLANFKRDEIEAAVRALAEEYPDDAAALWDETGYVTQILGYLNTELASYRETETLLAKTLAGKFCILGRVDTGTTDIGVNPFYGKYVNVGTHAVVLDTILSQSFITPLPFWWSIVLCLIFVPAVILAATALKPGPRAAAGFAAALLILAASFGLFYAKGVFLGPLGPSLALLLATILRETLAFMFSEKEKQFIRKAFSTYLSGDVVREIIADPSRLQLGGSNRLMTAIFTDVQGFSTISEKIQQRYGSEGPVKLVELLNDYLSAMSDIVLDKKGTIDKYEGDAIIAFFGAPLDLPDHAFRACASAVLMKKIEVELNKKYAETGLSPSPVLTRVGINTGHMVVGNMGTQNKMNYTIMGDAVNLAARLEGVNKQYGTWILASEDTTNETAGKILYRKLDRVRVVGKSEPVRLNNVLDLAETADPRLVETVRLFHAALDLFEARDWRAAKSGFEAVLHHEQDDAPAKKYLERCTAYIAKEPAADWDGVYNLNEK